MGFEVFISGVKTILQLRAKNEYLQLYLKTHYQILKRKEIWIFGYFPPVTFKNVNCDLHS